MAKRHGVDGGGISTQNGRLRVASHDEVASQRRKARRERSDMLIKVVDEIGDGDMNAYELHKTLAVLLLRHYRRTHQSAPKAVA